MSFSLEFHGATEQVTGSLYLLRTANHTVMLECGLVQGGRKAEKKNGDPFPVDVEDIDAVVVSHAHIDHSGRLPLLVKRGYKGQIFTQHASKALLEIMLPDSGYLNEKDVEWENKKRKKNGKALLEALYTRRDAEDCLSQIKGIDYGKPMEIVPGLRLTLHDAGHILGSSIVEMTCTESDRPRRLVFSGDLGYREAPVMNDPARIGKADAVMLESTYGDRLHRPYGETIEELAEIFGNASASHGNIMIPAFTVGRTQDLLYLMSEHEKDWGLDKWQIYIDSPMGIEATNTYARYRNLYGARLFEPGSDRPNLPHVHMTRSTEESMMINSIQSGAIIIAGSGMCSGGRIHHHLKNNIWRPECHLVIVGYQAFGTLGRRIVDGAEKIKLWGEYYPVRASVHTIGGLSAHADQDGLVDWYGAFNERPPVYLVHGEQRSQEPLAKRLRAEFNAPVQIARRGMKVDIG
ncbi:MAG: MBL fold metallo-hydrolase RNA specificity domain-containing protein [Gammaproteobacteria bacterium]